MISIVLTAPYEFTRQIRPVPEPGKNEVLLHIEQIGICGSDMQIYHGKHQHAKCPLVMGHECAAHIAALGENVSGLQTGDFVTVQPQIFCRDCYACRHGHTNACENLSFMGVHRDGFFQEYAVVPAWNVVEAAGETSDKAMLTEPMAVAVNAVHKGEMGLGKRAVVIGAGTIGNLVAQAAIALGAEVAITDILDRRLGLAAECGIRHCINTSAKVDLKRELHNHFDGESADVIFDCAAVGSLFEELLETAANASRLVVVGNYKAPVTFDVQRLQRREMQMYGVMQYTREDFLEARALLASGKIHTDRLITNRFPLNHLKEAFEYIDEDPGRSMKIAIMV